MTTLLRRAAERHFRSPCQGAFARDRFGMVVHTKSAAACAWCAAGAIEAEASTHEELSLADCSLTDACVRAGFFSIFLANDSPGGLDLMPDIWSEAIEADESQPLTGQALIDAREYEARRLEMIERGEQ